MSESTRPYNEIDDYIAAFSDEERQEYAMAETALDLASILYHIRQARGLTQREGQNEPLYNSKRSVVWRKPLPMHS